MKFTCEKALLLSAVSTASRTVAPHSSIPALEGILIEAQETLYLTGYNLETGIRAQVAAQILEQGSLVLPARLFGEIVRKLPDDVVTFTAQGETVKIRCGLSEYNLMGIAAEDFPELPQVDYENGFSLPENTLGAMVGGTLFAVSDNESRPIHTGSLFELDQAGLTVVSVDGFRLAMRHTALPGQTDEPFSFVVPGGALDQVQKICGDTDEKVTITTGARHVQFRFGTALLVSRRLEGEFLAWRNAVPRNGTVKVQGDTRALLASIDRVSLIISDKLKSPLRCLFEDGVVTLTTRTALGDATDQCPVQGNGGGLEIGFNNKYLMDALKAVPSERVCLELSSGVSPCVMVPAEGEEDFLYMVLPVRLRAGE